MLPGTPFQFAYEVSCVNWRREETLSVIRALAEKYVRAATRVNMLSRANERSNRTITCLEKVRLSANKTDRGYFGMF